MPDEAKTKATRSSVDAYLAAIVGEERRNDCKTLVALMRKVTGCPPVMWGTSIVGFDRYSYRYASGHGGESCIVGFAARKADLVVYLLAGYDDDVTRARLASLGKHKTGNACLYVKRLADVRIDVLEDLIESSVAETKRRHLPIRQDR
jgi:hypothetical protein